MTYRNDLQKYYVGFYGRPADVEGLEYWNSILEDEDGSLGFGEDDGFDVRFAEIQKFFAGTDPAGEQEEYNQVTGGLSSQELVDMIYKNLFGREAGVDDDRDYWIDKIDEGEGYDSIISIVDDIIGGIAEGSADEAIFQNRLDFAEFFTGELEATGKEFPTDDIRDLLNTVGETPDSLDDAKAVVGEWVADPWDIVIETGETGIIDFTEFDFDADDDIIFYFNIAEAQGSGLYTQATIAEFDVDKHSLLFTLPEDVDVEADNLGALIELVDGWVANYSFFQDELIAQFGSNVNGDQVTLTLQGVEDPTDVDISLAA